MIPIYVTLFVVCVLLSAFFSSSETAFISLQKAKLHHDVQQKVKGSARVLRLTQRPEKLLSTVILGNNLVQNAAVALATAISVTLFADLDTAVLVATIATTIIIIVFSESTPKAIGAHYAPQLSRAYARPIEWISWLFSPFVFVLTWISRLFTRMTGQKNVPASLASEEEIRAMISVGETEGHVEKAEAEMLHNVFEFTDRPVREIMIPRPDVVFIEREATVKEFMPIYSHSPLSRYPVFEGNRDNVIGILAIKDVLMALANEGLGQDARIDRFLRPVYITPETKPIGQLFPQGGQQGQVAFKSINDQIRITGLGPERLHQLTAPAMRHGNHRTVTPRLREQGEGQVIGGGLA